MSTAENDDDNNNDEVIQMNSSDDPDNNVDSDEPQDDNCACSDAQRSAALFILKTKEDRMLTQSALNGILQDMTGNLALLI